MSTLKAGADAHCCGVKSAITRFIATIPCGAICCYSEESITGPGGNQRMARDIAKHATKIKPLNDWQMVFVDVNEDAARGVNFFLGQNRLPQFTTSEKLMMMSLCGPVHIQE